MAMVLALAKKHELKQHVLQEAAFSGDYRTLQLVLLT